MTIDQYSDKKARYGDIYAYITDVRKQMTAAQKQCSEILRLDRPVSKYSPFVVSFVGRFKTGKSSLINALLGMEILPTKATTATTVITRIVYGSTACAYIRQHGDLRPVSIHEAQDVILNHKVTDVDNTPEVIFELPVDWLKGNVELRDTPGMDDSAQNGLLEKIALNALKDTDLCVLVYDAYQFVSAKEREIMKKAQEQLGGNVVFAVNRINLLHSIEGLNQVEKVAQTVFSGMGNDLVGNDRHYLMCSAPGMVDLDGFDVWLKDILSASNANNLDLLRNQAVSSRIRETYEGVCGNLAALEDESKDLLNELTAEHECRIDNVQGGINSAMRSRKNKIKEDHMEVEELICNTSGLEAHLKEKRSGDTQSYDAFSKQTVREYYTKRAEDVFSSCCPYMERYGYDFIAKAVGELYFPGTHSRSQSASGGKVGGGALLGGIIGSIFGFGVGTAIGAAIGAAIGGSSTSVDDSEANTVIFVQSNVLNAIKTHLSDVFSSELDRIDSEADDACAACKSGMEEPMKAVKGLMRDLDMQLTGEPLSEMKMYIE